MVCAKYFLNLFLSGSHVSANSCTPHGGGKKEKKQHLILQGKENLSGHIKYPNYLEGMMWPLTEKSNKNVLFCNRKYLFKIYLLKKGQRSLRFTQV